MLTNGQPTIPKIGDIICLSKKREIEVIRPEEKITFIIETSVFLLESTTVSEKDKFQLGTNDDSLFKLANLMQTIFKQFFGLTLKVTGDSVAGMKFEVIG